LYHFFVILKCDLQKKGTQLQTRVFENHVVESCYLLRSIQYKYNRLTISTRSKGD